MPREPHDLESLALLGEPVRRALYEWVVAAGRPVSRDEASAAVGVTRALAAFHLDRLVRDGLLAPEFRRLTGRTGRGAGRPAKLYRRGPREISVSLPERRYDVAAALMAEALEEIAEQRPPDELRAVARAAGRRLGLEARRHAGRRPGRRRLRDALVETLVDRGYEASEADGEIHLANCPFDALVQEHRDLVCGMNLALGEGLLAGLGNGGLRARLDPQPGRCCVAFGPSLS
jgi:predicted ArsR family transcriptional regulator